MNVSRPELMVLAVILPALMAAALAWYVRRRRRVAAALGDAALVRRLIGIDLQAVPWPRVACMMVAAAALGIAAADPRWGLAQPDGEGRALNLVLVLDVSNSMLVEDAAMGQAPNRLEVERLVARRLVRGLEGDRIGIVVFAGRAYILSPLTTDRGVLELYLDALSPSIVEQTGSSLSAAIRQATNLMAVGDSENEGSRHMVVVSDGDALEDPSEIHAAARRAARAGITVHAIGIGTEQGGPVPDIDFATGERVGLKVDPLTGENARSRMNQSLLREIASMTGGAYVRMDSQGALDRLLDRLREAERAPAGEDVTATRRELRAQYVWFVALALLLLALDVWWEARGGRRLKEA